MYEVRLLRVEEATWTARTVDVAVVDSIVDALEWRRQKARWAAQPASVLPDGYLYQLPLPKRLHAHTAA